MDLAVAPYLLTIGYTSMIYLPVSNPSPLMSLL